MTASPDMPALNQPPQPGRAGMGAGPRTGTEARLNEIDGIRGILSIIVVLGHTAVALGVKSFAGMQGWYWMPMDVFFSISGFLLGRIVISSGHRPGFLRSYFIRRMLRIWPAYYSVVLLVSAATFIAADHAADWPTLAFIKQITFLQFTEYLAFKDRGEYLYALMHTWSVAIEEHFYIILPLLVALLVRRASGVVVVALMSLALLSVFMRLIEDMHAWVLLTRLHGFAFGLLVAFVSFWAPTSPKWMWLMRSNAAVLVLVIFTLSWAFLSPFMPYGWVPHLNPTRLHWISQSLAAGSAGACLLLAICHTNLNGGPGIGILRNRALTHLGEISYSTYLWHWPLFVAIKPWVLQSNLSDFSRTLLAVVLVFAVANISYYCVEKPFLKLKRLWTYGPQRSS